mgnify:CR=1 FL=1
MTIGESFAEFFNYVDSFTGPMACFCNACSLWAIWILFCVIKDEYYGNTFDLNKMTNWRNEDE